MSRPKSLYGCQCSVKSDRQWVIVHYRCNYSAFNGYRRTPSDYSLVSCLKCEHSWRTKARYVNSLQIVPNDLLPFWANRQLKYSQVVGEGE